MDKSTTVHQKVAATFISTYYNAVAEGKTAVVEKMYLPNAKVNHWNVEGTAALAAYAKGGRVNVVEMEPRLIDNTHLKVNVKGSITLEGAAKKDFTHEFELVHHDTGANQLSFGVSSDILRAVATAPPPPPKMRFDDWSADTPTLNAQAAESEVIPDIELAKVKAATPQVTPKSAPAPAPAAPAPVEANKVEEAPKVEEKKVEEAKPVVAEAPKGWANIVRSQNQAAKVVVSVVDPTKKVAEKKKEVIEEKKEVVEEKKEKTEEKKERRSAKNATPIFYDVFVKGFPGSVTEADVPTALGLKVAVANTKIDTKTDKSGVRRVFVYVKLSAEDLTKQGLTREEAIAAIIANGKNAKFGNAKLNIEEVKERYNSDSTAAAGAKNKK